MNYPKSGPVNPFGHPALQVAPERLFSSNEATSLNTSTPNMILREEL